MKQLFAACTKIFAGAILFGSVSGCRVIDPAEDIPSYLHIDSISLSVSNPGLYGSATSDISDAWIFMDGQAIGAFELPCNVPILAEGTHTFSIRGGVRMNGLASTRAIYTYWKNWEGPVTLVRGQKVNVAPVVTYYPAINMPLQCNFETTNALAADPTSTTAVIRSQTDVYEGFYSGMASLNNTDSTHLWAYTTGYIMPANTDTWLEFDYKSTIPFTVGIRDGALPNNKVGWIVVQPNANWTKLYVRLNDPIAEAHQIFQNTPSEVPYQIYFECNTDVSYPTGKIYLDNIKLLK